MRARAGVISKVLIACVVLIVLMIGGAFVKGFLIGMGAISPNFPPASLHMVDSAALDPHPHFDAITNTSMNYPRAAGGTRSNSSPTTGDYIVTVRPGEVIGVAVDRNPPKAALGAVLMVSRGKNIPLSGLTGKLADVHSVAVDGHPGYLADLDLVINGQPARGRALMIMTADRKLYTVMGMALNSQWAQAEPVFESAFSTFHFGTGAPPLESTASYSPSSPPPAAAERSETLAPAGPSEPQSGIADNSAVATFAPDVPAAPATPAADATLQVASHFPAAPDVPGTNNDPPAPAIVPIPSSPTPESIADAVTRLKHHDWNTRYQSAVWLGKQKPVPGDDRSAVTGALADLLADPDLAIHTAALTSLHHWADASTEKVLAEKIPQATGDARHDLLDLAAALKTEGLAQAVAPLLSDAQERLWTRRCLLAMGPVAEKAVAAQLESDDPAVRVEACHLLETLGTRASIPALKAHLRVTEKDQSVQSAATLTISIIESRGK